jgi:hypothetical protein
MDQEAAQTSRGIGSFLDFVQNGSFRFYQERDLGLDLYSYGYAGVALFALAVASLVVFLLALFHTIPVRRTVVAVLLGLGFLAALVGFTRSFLTYHDLETVAAELLESPAGPPPSSDGQLAAIVALPLVVGATTLLTNVVGCLYMAAFWGGSLIRRSPKR